MAWDGYWEFDGTEVINVARVEAYAQHHGWFKPLFKNPFLAPMLGHRPYRSPMLDDAPWTDPDVLDSYDFCGVYPLSVEGVDSSTRSATVTESTGDGGIAGSVRHGTKQVAFNVALLGDSEAGVEYGLRWLRKALNGALCGPAACTSGTLCYLASEPEMDSYVTTVPMGAQIASIDGGSADDGEVLVLTGGGAGTTLVAEEFVGGDADDPEPVLTRSTSIFTVSTEDGGDDPTQCLVPYLRSLRKAVTITGPTVTSKRNLRSGGTVWTATFTVVAGAPFEVGPELEVIRGFLDPEVEVPWAGGVEPPGASIDLDGYMMSDELACAEVVAQPLYDPLHPALVLPPSVPSVPLGYYEPPLNWTRRQFTIPRQYVPLWGEMVPVLTFHARTTELRNLRLRFYADPFSIGDITDDPCAFCGDIVVSYVPESYSLTLDGVEETVTVTGPGGVTQRADSLVFASDGTPFEWPRLSCGFGYIVTLDLPATQEPPVVDLSLFERIL